MTPEELCKLLRFICISLLSALQIEDESSKTIDRSGFQNNAGGCPVNSSDSILGQAHQRSAMTPEEREVTEHRLIEINRRLVILASPEMSEEMPPELELDELYEERDQLKKELDEDVD